MPVMPRRVGAMFALCLVLGGPSREASAAPVALAQSTSKADDGEAATPTKKESAREWITHRVVPRETLDAIGARYGVSREEIIRWNKKKLHPKAYIYGGQKLKVYARVMPPPREKVTYIVKHGDTWSKIAGSYNVAAQDLRYWNKKVPKQFRAGTKLVVYTNPIARPAAHDGDDGDVALDDGDLPEVRVRSGGMAVGRPNRGKLVGGVRLEETDALKVRDPDKSYGTTHTIKYLQEAVYKFRKETGFDSKLTVGAISLRNGGRFRPHSSHQTGRDVDLRLPKKKGASEKSDSADDIDWGLSWKLVEALIETGEIEYIFLDWTRQKRLYRAATAAGASRKTIEQAIQYPRAKKTNNGWVRHAEGHYVHIHIRFKCAPDNSRCESY